MRQREATEELIELRAALDAANAQVRETTRELAGLLRVSANLAAQLELEPLLVLIIEEVQVIADYGRASIYLAEEDSLRLLASRSSNVEISGPPPSYSMPKLALGPLWDEIAERRPVLINDMHTDTRFVPAMRSSLGDRVENALRNVHSQLVVPLALKDNVIGMLTLTHEQPAFYTPHHAELITAIGTQAAIAIENARLFEQAQNAAAVTERQRLARELHDSVSQALYGIALGARTARKLLDEDPSKAVEPLDYVVSLASAGQAEMRALLFELRPESLALEGLVVALEKQVAATAARYSLQVDSEFCPEPELLLSEKEVFYRIGQEALHNIVKHAHATNASLRLTVDEHGLALEIRDDGVGFEVGQGFPGHMGLVSMQERASSIGGVLSVVSTPGSGATVRLHLPRAMS
ncbi:MAG: histidine kinase [Dehalococcoidia bacterium]